MIYNVNATYRSVGIGSLSMLGSSLLGYVEKSGMKDYVLLETCNRRELYSTQDIALAGFDRLMGKQAMGHLFRVACGLDSMIMGENEILSQVKKAKDEAEFGGHLGPELSGAFDAALRLGGKARARTGISEGRTSIASLAVEYALSQKVYPTDRVLIIGSGTMGSKIAHALKNKGVDQIFLANRRAERAEALARKVGGSVADYRRLTEYLSGASVVFTATSAPHPIIRPGMVTSSSRILFLDLGVPYDVSEEVEKLQNAEVVRMQHFIDVAEANTLKKINEARKVERMIDESVDRLWENQDYEKLEIKKTF